MASHQAFDSGKAILRCVHYIVSGGAMDMNVDEAGSQDGIAVVDNARVRGHAQGVSRADRGNRPVFNHERSLFNPLQRREELPG
jgi:hypothetical protein